MAKSEAALMRTFAQIEQAGQLLPATKSPYEVSPAIRMLTFNYVSFVARELDMQADFLCKTMALFDVCCASKKVQAACLPDVTAAVISLVYKHDGVQSKCYRVLDCLLEASKAYEKGLLEVEPFCGFVPARRQQIQKHEAEVLGMVGWRLPATNEFWWMNLLHGRLSSMTIIRVQHLKSTLRLSTKHAPRTLVTGALGLGFMIVGVWPVEVLRPAEWGEADWLRQLKTCAMGNEVGSGAGLPTGPSQYSYKHYSRFLFGCTIRELSCAVGTVVIALLSQAPQPSAPAEGVKKDPRVVCNV